MTEPGSDLKKRLAEAARAYAAMDPVDRALHDAEQRRSFVRGQCGQDPGPDVLAEEVRRLRNSLASERARADKAERYAALGEACEANGLAEWDDKGEMRFQAPQEVIEEHARSKAEAELDAWQTRAHKSEDMAAEANGKRLQTERELAALKERVAGVLEPFENFVRGQMEEAERRKNQPVVGIDVVWSMDECDRDEWPDHFRRAADLRAALTATTKDADDPAGAA